MNFCQTQYFPFTPTDSLGLIQNCVRKSPFNNLNHERVNTLIVIPILTIEQLLLFDCSYGSCNIA